MKKILPRFLLFISLFSLFSCTLTKRKYTGGYYINWHSKAPEAIAAKPAHATNKIAQTNSSFLKTKVEPQPAKMLAQKIVQEIYYLPQEKGIAKNVSYNSPTYKVVPENAGQGHSVQQHHTPRGLPVLFGLLSIFFGWLTLGFCIGATGTFSTVLILTILTLLFIFLAISKAVKIIHEIKENPGSGGMWAAVLGIVFAIFGVLLLIIPIYLIFSVLFGVYVW